MPPEPLVWGVKILAVIGGGFVGGLVTGWLVRILVLVFFGQKLPGWLHWTFRFLGLFLAGWLVWLFVFGDGLGGFGWPFGNSKKGKDNTTSDRKITDKTDEDKVDKDKTDKDKDSPKKDTTSDHRDPPRAESLTIEILANSDLDRLAEKDLIAKGFNDKFCYRIEKSDPRKLLELKDVQRLIQGRLESNEPPRLRQVILIRYKYTPLENKERVADLKDWAKKQRISKDTLMRVDVIKKDEEAPID